MKHSNLRRNSLFTIMMLGMSVTYANNSNNTNVISNTNRIELINAAAENEQNNATIINLDTPGLLKEKLGDDLTTITNLIITGTMNEDDFLTLYKAKAVEILDISTVQLVNKDGSNTNKLYDYSLSSLKALKHVILPECVEIIGKQAFSFSKAMETCVLPSNLKEIKEKAFMGCKEMTIESFPSTIETIGKMAFMNLEKLTSFTGGDALVSLGDMAFFNTGVKEVNLGKKFNDMGSAAFGGCKQLERFVVADDNTNFKIINDALFDKKGETLIAFPMGSVKEYFETPASTKQISISAFDGAQHLKELHINEGITTIPNSMCHASVVLDKVYLPSSITRIEVGAFDECGAVTEMHLAAITPPAVDEGAFGVFMKNFNMRLFVPMGSVTAYKSLDWSKDFLEVVAELGDSMRWWGYFNGNYNQINFMGMGKASTYNCAIKIPASHIMGKGRTIKGIRIPIGSKKNMENFKIWISTSLPNTADDADLRLVDINTSKLIDTNNPNTFVNELMFPETYTIEDKDVYIGYSFDITYCEDGFDKNPIILGIIETTAENSTLLQYDGSWEDLAGQNFGNLAVEVLMEGEYNKNAITLSPAFDETVGVIGSDVSVPVRLTNYGLDKVNSFAYTVTNAAGTTGKTTVNVTDDTYQYYDINRFGGSAVYNLDITLNNNAIAEKGTISIVEVNGIQNPYAGMNSSGTLTSVKEAPARKIALEENTSTNNGLCAYGFVGIEKARSIFGEKLVIVSVHDGDAMNCEDYKAFKKNNMKTLPSVNVDRKDFFLHPYFGYEAPQLEIFGLKDNISACSADVAPAAIDVKGIVLTDENILKATSMTKFMYDAENVDYAVAYVVTEDDMTGDDKWIQYNGLSGDKLLDYDPLFTPWVEASEYVEIPFNNVAIAAQGIEYGVEGSIVGPVKLNETQEYTTEFNLNDYPIIQNVENLKVNAFLINTINGKIVNAASAPVTVTTDIKDINNADSLNSVSIYTADGHQINTPVKGINIFKYSNGSTRKVIIK